MTSAPSPQKKMIILKYIKSIHVYKNCDVDIEFNVSFEEVQNFKSTSTFAGVDFVWSEHKEGVYSEMRRVYR